MNGDNFLNHMTLIFLTFETHLSQKVSRNSVNKLNVNLKFV